MNKYVILNPYSLSQSVKYLALGIILNLTY